MIEKLRSHLRKTRGFTLVELLIVIAIIAILVLLVIIALDPLERIRDGNDRSAQNGVRQAGSAIMACITKELSRTPVGTPFVAGNCDDEAVGGFLETELYIQSAASLTGVTVATNVGQTSICATHLNAGGHDVVRWNSDDTLVNDPEVAAGVCH